MKASELRDLSDDKLRETIATSRRDVFAQTLVVEVTEFGRLHH